MINLPRLLVAVIACGLLLAMAPAHARTPQLVDLDGRNVDPFAAAEASATVLIFVRTDCPISNSYAPEFRRLHAEFSLRGVTFHLIYLDPSETNVTIRQHLQEFALSGIPLRDSGHVLARLCEVRVTPEAAVFRQRQRIYAGRIDDRYIGLGKSKPKATTHELAEAITATLAGQPAPRASAPAVGCPIRDLE